MFARLLVRQLSRSSTGLDPKTRQQLQHTVTRLLHTGPMGKPKSSRSIVKVTGMYTMQVRHYKYNDRESYRKNRPTMILRGLYEGLRFFSRTQTSRWLGGIYIGLGRMIQLTVQFIVLMYFFFWPMVKIVGTFVVLRFLAKKIGVPYLLARRAPRMALALETVGHNLRNEYLWARLWWWVNPFTAMRKFEEFLVPYKKEHGLRQDMCAYIAEQVQKDRRFNNMFSREAFVGMMDDLGGHASGIDRNGVSYDGWASMPVCIQDSTLKVGTMYKKNYGNGVKVHFATHQEEFIDDITKVVGRVYVYFKKPEEMFEYTDKLTPNSHHNIVYPLLDTMDFTPQFKVTKVVYVGQDSKIVAFSNRVSWEHDGDPGFIKRHYGRKRDDTPEEQATEAQFEDVPKPEDNPQQQPIPPIQ